MSRFRILRPGRRRGFATRVAFVGVGIAATWLVAAGALADEHDATDEPGARRFEHPTAMERWADASPEERRVMRGRQRARWESATPRERRRFARRLRRLERALPEFDSIERLMLMRVAADLPRAERRDLRERIAGLDELEPEDRKARLAALREMIEGYEGEVRRLERNSRRWQRMSESERDVYRSQMKRWHALSDEEREALLDEMERRRDGDDEGSD